MSARKLTESHENNICILPPKHERAISLIVSGKSITEAAEEVGLSRSHLSRLLSGNPIVKAELERQRIIATRQTADKMRGMLNKAVDVIEESLSDETISAEDRLKAAVSILGKIAPNLTMSAEPINPELAARREAEAQSDDNEIPLFQQVDQGTVERILKKYYREIQEAEGQ